VGCYNPLLGCTTVDLGTAVDKAIDWHIIQNCQAVQSIGRTMDWTLRDNMISFLFFNATCTGLRRDHSLFMRAGGKHSTFFAELIKWVWWCSWQSHPKKAGVDVGDESKECRSAPQPRHPHSIGDPLRASNFYCAAGTNACLYWKCRSFAAGGQVST